MTETGGALEERKSGADGGLQIGEFVRRRRTSNFDRELTMTVDRADRQPPTPGAICSKRFRVEAMSPRRNRLFSVSPIALYAGLAGLRSKTFAIDGSRCRSTHARVAVGDAEAYAKLAASGSISARAAPESTSRKIEPIAA